jgi:hypothetical protein
MLTLFNPSLEIQSTDNFIDWTSVECGRTRSVTWTSRTIPMGTDNPIDICHNEIQHCQFGSAHQSKVKKLGVVERVIASVYLMHKAMLKQRCYQQRFVVGH